ncbi:MAG TPA: YceI family protein [Candidatus Binatia bacterium]|jgi:polyisoprenoid-binding protein YceI
MSSERARPGLVPGLALLVLSLAAAVPAVPATTDGPARGGVLRLDPGQTRIAFRLPGALHETHGTFRLVLGTLAVDPTGDASGTVIVDAASADSDNTARDERMKRVVLESDRYPEIRFEPTRVEGAMRADGGFHATMHGALTLHGAVHEVVIEAEGRVVGDELTATSRFVVPYVAWGLTDPSVLLLSVAKEVQLEVDAAGRVTWSAGA